jgi:DNA uptake protein ComE-like DNA-binding protein
MRSLPLRFPLLCLVAAIAIATGSACSNNNANNPDQIRQRTAEATETVRQDAKAIADGVKEGMASDHKAIDLNKASREELLSLPGLTDRDADRIIAGRPFVTAHDLVSRRIVTQSEYDQIRGRVIAAQ